VIICLIGVEINVSLASRMATAAVFERLSLIIPLIDGLSDLVVVFWGRSLFHLNYSASAETPTITLWQFLFSHSKDKHLINGFFSSLTQED
jgi:hypothetical protein